MFAKTWIRWRRTWFSVETWELSWLEQWSRNDYRWIARCGLGRPVVLSGLSPNFMARRQFVEVALHLSLCAATRKNHEWQERNMLSWNIKEGKCCTIKDRIYLVCSATKDARAPKPIQQISYDIYIRISFRKTSHPPTSLLLKLGSRPTRRGATTNEVYFLSFVFVVLPFREQINYIANTLPVADKFGMGSDAYYVVFMFCLLSSAHHSHLGMA